MQYLGCESLNQHIPQSDIEPPFIKILNYLIQ